MLVCRACAQGREVAVVERVVEARHCDERIGPGAFAPPISTVALPCPGMSAGLLVLLLVVVSLAVVIAAGLARRHWRRTTDAVVAAMLAARRGGPGPAEAFTEPTTLPPPVQRYLDRALRPDMRPVTVARLEQEGEFRLGTAWKPFRATQVFRLAPPAFCWDADIRMAPGLHVLVRDGYDAGRGSMQGALGGLFTLVRAGGGPEIASAALQRFLAEAMWFPMALWPGPRLAWTPIDERAARATLTDGEVTAAIEFRFDEQGDVVSAFTPARFRAEQGRFVPMPWGGQVLEWAEHDGVRIASAVEVGWYEPGGFAPFYRGRVASVRYERDGSA
jgi:hypothetical protein